MKMTTIIKTSLMTTVFAAGALLSSCAFEDETSFGGTKGNMLVKAPIMTATSGGEDLGNKSRGANVNGNMWYQEWDRPSNVTPEEIQKVLEAVAEPRYNVQNEITITWENYWVQQVYKGEQTYEDHYGKDRGKGSDLMNELSVWNDNGYTYWPETHPGGYEVINNFNKGDNTTTYTDGENGYQYVGTTLMTGMACSDASNQFAYKNSADGSKYYFDYIVIEVDGEYYVCFDFFADNRDNPTATANKDHYVDRDWIFNDWIVKISPAYHKGTTPEKPEVTDPNPGEQEPEHGEDEILCPECGHWHVSNMLCAVCMESGTDSPCAHEDGDHEVDSPAVKPALDGVEINLALNNKEDENLLESHLSIHVRSAVDVKVFIPVPAKYYCDADDMMIVLDKVDEFVHGGPHRTEYEIGGKTVSLNVAFSEEGITIWTEGIDQDVIDYCQAHYNDGITFEIWNYFNDPETGLPNLSKEELREMLDRATVEFIEGLPSEYVNSFGKVNGKYDSATGEGNDFHVTPEKQAADFNTPGETDTSITYNKKPGEE